MSHDIELNTQNINLANRQESSRSHTIQIILRTAGKSVRMLFFLKAINMRLYKFNKLLLYGYL